MIRVYLHVFVCLCLHIRQYVFKLYVRIQAQQTTLIDSYCNYKFMTDIRERLLHSAQKLVLPDIYPNRVCKFDLMPHSTNSPTLSSKK